MLQYFREQAEEEQTDFGRERRSESQSKGESECRLCISSARVLEGDIVFLKSSSLSVLSYDLGPYIQGVERQTGGAISHGKGGGGTQIIQQHRNSGTLSTILTYGLCVSNEILYMKI